MGQNSHFVTPSLDLTNRYIIWSPEERTSTPTVVFFDRPSAIKAATAMAHQFPSKRFAVCKIVGLSTTTAVKYTSFDGKKAEQ